MRLAAERYRLAGRDAGAGVAPAGERAGPRTTVQSPLRWSDDPAWKLDYSNIARLSPEEIARRRAEFDRGKEIAQRLRDAKGVVREG